MTISPKINLEFGTKAGDQFLSTFSETLKEQVIEARGHSHVARYNAETFLIFLGDTGPRNATSSAERIRQTFEGLTFALPTSEFDITVTNAVTEVGKDEKTHAIFKRLQKTLNTCETEWWELYFFRRGGAALMWLIHLSIRSASVLSKLRLNNSRANRKTQEEESDES